MKTLSLILTITIIVGCLYVIVPALGKAFAFLNTSKTKDEHNPSVTDLLSFNDEPVTFIIIDELPDPQEQARINHQLSR